MEQHMTQVVIPEGLTFSDLHLTRQPDGDISFDWAVIKQICAASNLPIEHFRDTAEANVAGLIVGWYQAHRSKGGEPDTVADDLIAEVMAEEASGQSFSHDPGRA